MLTKRKFVQCLKYFKPTIMEASWNCKENNTENEWIVKTVFAQLFMFFENIVPLNMRLRCSQGLSLLTKWAVFWKNVSGNPTANVQAFSFASVKAFPSFPQRLGCHSDQKAHRLNHNACCFKRGAGLQPSLKNVRQKIPPNGQTRLKFRFSYEHFTTQSFSVLPTPFWLNVS